MAWAKNGTPDTLSGTSATMSITDLTAKQFNQILAHGIGYAGNSRDEMEFNNDSNSVYAERYSVNGGTDATQTSLSAIDTISPNDNDDHFSITYLISISGEEKLQITHTASRDNAGVATAPARVELVGKFVPSPDADITEVEYRSPSTMASGSNLSALTGDETETVTLQDGTIFEETDTNKAYIWSSSSKTWTQL